jgi:D-arginine dehydrogenase
MGDTAKNFDFVIVGGGIVGASVAYELSESASVCLLEAEDRPGMHSTARSAALFAPSYGGHAIRALTRASRHFFLNPAPGFSDAPLLLPRDCLYIARKDQLGTLEALVNTVVRSGGTIYRVSVEEALARVPLLRREYLAEGAVDPDAMDIEVSAAHQGYLRGAKARGAIVLTHHRLRAATFSQGSWTIQADEQQALRARVLINAAGAWADEVARACGARPVGLQPLRRTALLVDAPAGVDVRSWPAVIDTEELFYFKPEAGKLLLSPADETLCPPGDAQPEELDVAIAVDRVQQALAIEVRRVTHKWAGLRTFAPDRAPVVGFDPDVAAFFWCAGQGGYGIQSAPATARAVASAVKGEPLPADIRAEDCDLTNLSPARFSRSNTASHSER